jgi:hypothetical protein
MTAPNDLDRLLAAFLRDGPAELPDPSFDAVRGRMETTRQRGVIGPWRMPDMNKLLPIGLGAAAVVVVFVAGTQLFGPRAPTGVGVAPSASPSPTTDPSPSPSTSTSAEGGLAEGPFVLLTGQTEDPANNFPPLTVTIPAPGWEGEPGGGILSKNYDHQPPDDPAMIVFVQPEYIVYGDACHWTTTTPDTPVTTVDEFVAALSSQGSRTASGPVDITLGGYAGKSITLEVPADVDFTDCDPGHGGSWDCQGDGTVPCGYHGGPEAIDTVYVLDLDGLIMAWQTGYYTATTAEDIAELEAIVQSAAFGD